MHLMIAEIKRYIIYFRSNAASNINKWHNKVNKKLAMEALGHSHLSQFI